MQHLHVVQVTGTSADVFGGTFGEDVPRWARRARVQVQFSDQDAVFDARIFGIECARGSAPHICAADNTNQIDFRQAHIVCDVPPQSRGSQGDVLVALTVTTGGTGLIAIQYES